MKRRRTQAERSTATRQALVEAAIRRLIAEGYAGATVRNIARESGVSPGAVQYHFKSKEDIAIAALTHLFEEVALRLAAISSARHRHRRARPPHRRYAVGVLRRHALLRRRRDPDGHAPAGSLHRRVRACRLGLAAAYRDMWDRLMGDTLLDRRHGVISCSSSSPPCAAWHCCACMNAIRSCSTRIWRGCAICGRRHA